MKNLDALVFFTKLALKNPSPLTVKISKDGKSDFSKEDTLFVRNFVTKDSSVLDVGSGSGLFVNKISPYIKKIDAIEPFTQFTKFIAKRKNIDVYNVDANTFTTKDKYDVITFLGVMQYFNTTEALSIYKKYSMYLKPKGIIIVKNQFGINEDVLIDSFSKELGTIYYSHYRMLKTEAKLLTDVGLSCGHYFDIYPPSYSRWENTHFYALIAYKELENVKRQIITQLGKPL